MNPPVEPSKEDCCNSGCNPCIFDVYEKQLKLYEQYKEHIDSSCNVLYNGISQLEYKTFYLLNIVQLCDTLKILTFQEATHDNCKKVFWNPGDHFLIKYTKDSITCTRAYTPIKMKLQNICLKECNFHIAVKKYESGLVSNYLFNLKVGQETKWRGPYGSYEVQPNKFNRIIMIAQGTGVAPFMSIIQSILNNEDDMTKIILYYCCKKINEVLFRDELYEFKSFWNFSYKIFISEYSKENQIDVKYSEPIVNKKFNLKQLNNLYPHINDQFLLCGSIEFMKEYQHDLKTGRYSDNIILF